LLRRQRLRLDGLLARVHEGEGEVLDAALLFVRETDALAGLGLDRARGVLIGAREVRGELLFRGALERERAEARPGDAREGIVRSLRRGAVARDLVAAFPDAAAQKINIITSSDGGSTWSANIQVSSQALVAGYGGIDMSRPTYDAVTGDWYLVISSSSGTNSTEVFRSANAGASWTSVFYRSGATAPIFLEAQALGALVVAFEGSGLAAYSVDRGVTWRRVAALSGTANRLGVRGAGGMLMVTNSADKTMSTSHRVGVSGVVL
jgi:hypothetical protein